MSDLTRIEWADATWNPAWGCTKISPGCKFCYAERIVGEENFKHVRETKWRKKAKQDPRSWHTPKLVFTLSMGDFFHEACDAWRDEWWDVIRSCPQHIFLVLTKRPERIAQHLPRTCFACGFLVDSEHPISHTTGGHCSPWNAAPWPNVWLGVSVESQLYLKPRVDTLISIPAQAHFLSCEPLLGPIDFFDLNALEGEDGPEDPEAKGFLNHIEWVISGGESGDRNHRRETKPEWFSQIRDQAKLVGVPYLHKQNGGVSRCACHGAWGCRVLDGHVHDEIPALPERFARIPRKTTLETYEESRGSPT